ncbi:MAG: nicotinate-nucleotide adenylyltransferase [Pseudomonadota bacterium]
MKPSPDSAPLGIMGGTFDPVHFGHLRLAEEARQALGLARVLWIPAGQPPHRAAPGVAAEDRLQMVRLAVARNSHFQVDDAEVRSAAPSYSVATLERLRALHGPQRPLVLLLGSDAFTGLPTWHRWEELFALAHIGVATRPGYELTASALPPPLAHHCATRLTAEGARLARQPAGCIATFAMTALAISASAIRAAIAAGRSVAYLLPDSVLDYIETKGLYLPHGR